MIRSALATFINVSELPAAFPGLVAFVQTPDFVFSEHPLPRCVATYLHEGAQELWVIGDAQRKENPELQLTFSMKSFEDVKGVRARFRRIIESAFTFDVGGLLHPGIDYIISGDLLRNSGDNKTYFSDQPGWFASPAPKVFKNEDSNGNPVQIFAGFTIDPTVGSVTFAVANSPTDRIRATYKCGIIDFNIAGVAEPQIVDAENNPSKFNVVFDLVTHFYIKTNANRYI